MTIKLHPDIPKEIAQGKHPLNIGVSPPKYVLRVLRLNADSPKHPGPAQQDITIPNAEIDTTGLHG